MYSGVCKGTTGQISLNLNQAHWIYYYILFFLRAYVRIGITIILEYRQYGAEGYHHLMGVVSLCSPAYNVYLIKNTIHTRFNGTSIIMLLYYKFEYDFETIVFYWKLSLAIRLPNSNIGMLHLWTKNIIKNNINKRLHLALKSRSSHVFKISGNQKHRTLLFTFSVSTNDATNAQCYFLYI